MDQNEAKKIISKLISEIIGKQITTTENDSLIGENAVLDPMQLVELCLALEDLADELGFEFDWTSSAAMSKTRGMFRSIASLSSEFSRQSVN